MREIKTKVFGIEKSHILFYTAKDFFEKGLEATKKVHPPIFTFEKQPVWQLSFPICTLSFSLELALKGFLTNEEIKKLSSKKKGHNFEEIYGAIDISTRTAIENHFENCRAHNYSFFNLVLKGKSFEVERPKEDSVNGKIMDALKRCKNSYPQFRYLQEFKEDNYYFDFNTIIKLIHSSLAIQASNLGLEL